MVSEVWIKDWLKLTWFIGICLVAGILGAWATSQSVASWYPMLAKPSWNPPSFVFGPVWTTLYILMGTAAWLVWRSSGWAGARKALTLFGVQLVFNTAWSFFFFGMRNPALAMVDLAALWIALTACALAFKRHNALAFCLMIPYWLWVTFAGALNFTIWHLNRPA